MLYGRRLPLLLALFALLVAPAVGKDAPAQAPATMADAVRIQQRNLQVLMQGQQAGGVTMRVGTMKDGAVVRPDPPKSSPPPPCEASPSAV